MEYDVGQGVRAFLGSTDELPPGFYGSTITLQCHDNTHHTGVDFNQEEGLSLSRYENYKYWKHPK